MAIPKERTKAPDFALEDQDGKLHRLSDYRGKKVVLYFYPKDMTTGCTVEACQFRDRKADITKKGAVVLGISNDSVKSHKKFEAKERLNFTLLSDPKKEVVKKYGVWGKKVFMGQHYMGINRTTFLIDKNRTILKVFQKVSPKGHDDEVLAEL
ncbi:MAG TPA: thioredoxin-dependent thiol peroxidase [Candidatus Binatia bacterium]|nr:thioredoxin-dependent thiol peroxidase [Candidatus Binatia bacterium]